MRQRQEARVSGKCDLERRLHKLVRKSVKSDRSAWLDSLAEHGTWEGVRPDPGATLGNDVRCVTTQHVEVTGKSAGSLVSVVKRPQNLKNRKTY